MANFRTGRGDYSAPPMRASEYRDDRRGRDDRPWSHRHDDAPDYGPSGGRGDGRYDDRRGMHSDRSGRDDYRSGEGRGGYRERDRQPHPGEPNDTIILEGVPARQNVEVVSSSYFPQTKLFNMKQTDFVTLQLRGALISTLGAQNTAALEYRFAESGGKSKCSAQNKLVS